MRRHVEFQWIWLGLIDGQYANRDMSTLKSEVHKNSWIVLINDDHDKNEIVDDVKNFMRILS